MGTAMIPKSEQTRWTSREAAIKAEIDQAKNTFDLVRMAKQSCGWTRFMPKWKQPRNQIATAKPKSHEYDATACC